MFQQVIISDNIEIKPCDLTPNWEDNFLAIAKKKELTVSKKHGAIIEIKNLIEKKNPIIKNSKIIAPIKFEAIVFKPELDQVYSSNITNINDLGIVINHNNNLIKIFFNESYLKTKGYKFNKIRQVYTNELNSLEVGDKIYFTIKSFQYTQTVPMVLRCISYLADKEYDIAEPEEFDILEPDIIEN